MIKSSEAAAALREKLQQGETHFVFKKKDGSRRQAVGTLNFEIIPEEDTQFKSDERREERDDQVTYYDLEKMAWRCCKTENILEQDREHPRNRRRGNRRLKQTAMYDIFNQIKEDTDAFLKEADEFIERQKQFNNQLKTQNHE